MIRELHIQNFKAWMDSGSMKLAPLTVFCGNNSSGKSSIAQLLLMLKQTAESYDRQQVLDFGGKDGLPDLGDYKSIVNKHEVDKRVAFGFTFDCSPIKVTDTVHEKDYGPYRQLGFNAILSQQENKRLTVDQCNYTLINGTPMAVSLKHGGNGKYKLTAQNYTLSKRVSSALPAPENFFGFPDEAIGYYSNTGFLSDLSLAMKNLFRSIYYVGPLRNKPARFYQYSGESPNDVGTAGEKTIFALLAAMDKSLIDEEHNSADRLDQVVARWLKEMKLISGFRLRRIARGRKEYEVLIKIQPGSPEVLITDVGFGISQVLPVIVECFYTPKNSTIIFEQPEIHLHPSVQAHLADVFIEATKRVKRQSEKQIIVESHSEHLIRRIQRRIAEGSLSAEDVAIYFVRQEHGDAKIERLDINNYGSVTNWPENFFGDDLEDIIAINESVIRKKLAKR